MIKYYHKASSRPFYKHAVVRDWNHGETRDFYKVATHRKFGLLDSANRVVGWSPLAWETWGQSDITPFDFPTGVDSTKTFGDLP